VYNRVADERDQLVTASGVNVEIYQTMAEILVTVRRIVHRGLVKVSGPTWYKDGCPPGLFDRLVARKENELSIDRFDREYQELIGYASLDDLAEIIEYNEDLAELLQAIAPEEATMLERFREIEALRLKLAAAAPFDDDDVETLFEFHKDFRYALERRMQKPNGEKAPVTPPPPPEPPAVPADADAGKEAAPDEVGDVEAEIGEVAEEGGGGYEDFRTLVVDRDTTSLELADVASAMADGDDVQVLRVLREEVMVVAEGVLQNDLQREYVVWEAVNAAGWFKIKKNELEIEPLEDFYTAVEAIRETHRTGGGLEAIKAHLQVVEFSKLLLALREMFLKHGL
jgi:hypothetical protein